MALLNPPNILPVLAEAILRYLLTADRGGAPRDSFTSLMMPDTLISGDSTPRSSAFENTLRASEMLGLVSIEGNLVSLGPRSTDLVTGSSRSQLRACIRSAVLEAEVNVGPWGSQQGAKDLTYSLAWFLAQDVYAPPGLWDAVPPLISVQRLQLDQIGRLELIVNETRWQAFGRWAPFLGMARHHVFEFGRTGFTEYLVPDPTPGVRDALREVCPGSSGELAFPFVVDELARTLPILDGGYIRVDVESGSRVRLAPPEGLSSSLSNALQRLESAGLFTLEDRADAPNKLALTAGGNVTRRVSHLTWSKAMASEEAG